MKLSIDKAIQQRTDLFDKTEKLDEDLKDIRVKINDVLWDLVEMRKEKVTKNDKKKDKPQLTFTKERG